MTEEGIAKSFTAFLPKDQPEERSRSVKICTKSSHIVIIFLFLSMLLTYTVVKSLFTANRIDEILLNSIYHNYNKTKEE